MIKNKIFDVIIIGGSYSGLSAALSLARFRREILIIDYCQPSNRFSPVSHNFLTRDKETQPFLAKIAKEQLMRYSCVTNITNKAVYAQKMDNNFMITTQNGDIYNSKKLILATGVRDIIPPIKGFKECWGITAVHCPYCHGYEAQSKKTVILGNDKAAYNMAILVRNLTSQLIVLTENKADFTELQLEKLRVHNIEIIENSVTEIQHTDGTVGKIILSDGNQIDTEFLYAMLPFQQQSDIAQQLGCDFTRKGLIKVNRKQRTTIGGVYACGDNSAAMRSISKAVYAGSLAGAMINKKISENSF